MSALFKLKLEELKPKTVTPPASSSLPSFDFKTFVKNMEEKTTNENLLKISNESQESNNSSPLRQIKCSKSAPPVTLSDSENDSEKPQRYFNLPNKDENMKTSKFRIEEIKKSNLIEKNRETTLTVAEAVMLKQCINALEAKRAEDHVTFSAAKANWMMKNEKLQKDLEETVKALHETSATLRYIARSALNSNNLYALSIVPPNLLSEVAQGQYNTPQMLYTNQPPTYIHTSNPSNEIHIPSIHGNPHHLNSNSIETMMLIPGNRNSHSLPQDNNTFQESWQFRAQKRHRQCSFDNSVSNPNLTTMLVREPSSPLPPDLSSIEGKWGTTDGQEGTLRASDASGLVRVLFVQWNGMGKHSRRTIGEAELYLQSAGNQIDSKNIIFHCFSRPPGTRGLRARVPLGSMWDMVFQGSPLLARFKYSSRVFTDTCNAKDLRKSSRPSRMHGFHENIFTAHRAVRNACIGESAEKNSQNE